MGQDVTVLEMSNSPLGVFTMFAIFTDWCHNTAIITGPPRDTSFLEMGHANICKNFNTQCNAMHS